MMPLADEGLQAFLDLPPKMLAIRHVDPTVHEAEAIRRANDGIDTEIKDGAAVDADAIQVAGEPLPYVEPFFIVQSGTFGAPRWLK